MDERQLLAELRVVRERGDRAAECEALGIWGLIYDQQQRWQEALQLLTEYLIFFLERFAKVNDRKISG